jgi:hypothetical protein
MMSEPPTLAERLLARLYVRYVRTAAYFYTYRFDRRLFTAYRFLESGKAVGAKSQPWRGYDIIRHLKAERPRRIVEFGSGTSTAVLASFAASQGAEVLTFEQDDGWCKLTREALSRAGLLSPRVDIVQVSAVATERGTKFARLPEGEIDWLYVDGPVTAKRGGRKLPCLDTLELFDRGVLPGVILVDGRYDTVRAICHHPSSRWYEVQFEYGLSLKPPFCRHTVFRRIRKETA